MKKIISALLTITLLLCMLSGCSGKSVSNVDENGQEKITISFSSYVNSAATEAEKQIEAMEIAEFEKAFPNIKVEVRPNKPGDDIREQYDKSLMANDSATVLRLPAVDIQSRINNGTIADMSKYMENFDLRLEGKVMNQFDDAITKDGKWYAAPFSSYVIAHAYNTETILAGGGDPKNLPTDWASFAEFCQNVSDKKAPRFGYILLGSDYIAWNFTPWVWSAGGEMVRPNTDGTYSLGLNEEPGVDAAMFWHDLIWKYGATQTDLLENWDDVQSDIQSGYGAFGWGDAARYGGAAKEKFGLDPAQFGTAPIPAKDAEGKPVSFAGGTVWVMSPQATEAERDAAWEFIKFISYDEEQLNRLWKMEGEYEVQHVVDVPARVDLTEVKYSYANWPEHWAKEYAEVAKYAIAEPFCANWNDFKNLMVIPLQKILLEENITREQAQKILDDCVTEAYETWPDSFRPTN